MKNYFVKNKKRLYFFLWLLSCGAFFLLLYYGFYTKDDEVVYFWQFAPKLFKNTKNTVFLVFPSLLTTFLLVVAFLFVRFRISSRLLFYFDLLPTIFSAIPLFITAIIFIRYFKLDTMNSYNFAYGITCLSLFNLNYLYQKLKTYINIQYQEPYVLYAKSIGVLPKDIFRYYVLPGLIPHVYSTLRELLPHVIMESIVIEYIFSYNALLKSAIQALQHDNWHYLILFFCVVVLLVSFFEIKFWEIRDVEKKNVSVL